MLVPVAMAWGWRAGFYLAAAPGLVTAVLIWVSLRDRDVVQVYDTATFTLRAELPAQKPSGIFFSSRAGRIGF